jgi:hypothetical protein
MSSLTNNNLSINNTKNTNTVQPSSFGQLLQTKRPYGIYNAAQWDSMKNILPNSIDPNTYAIASGGQITFEELVAGNHTLIPYIYGSTSSTLEWPTCSLASEFTICSITRYVDKSLNKTILRDTKNQIIHGHYNGTTGYVKYGKVISTANTQNPLDWTVCCATSKGIHPNNVLVNGVPTGTGDDSSIPTNVTGNKLIINGSNDGFSASDTSNFALAYVIIWNQILTTDELKVASDALNSYLKTGIISSITNDGGQFNLSIPDVTNHNIMIDTGKIQYVNERQNYANQVIMDESKRLQNKRDTVDTGLSGQKRMIQINNNYNKRYTAFTHILYLYIIALVIYIGFIIFDKFAFALSAGLLNKLAITLIGGCLIYSLYIYYTIYTRDPLDFDKLALITPTADRAQNGSSSSTSITHPVVKFAGTTDCTDGLCCSQGTQWNTAKGKCEPIVSMVTSSSS